MINGSEVYDVQCCPFCGGYSICSGDSVHGYWVECGSCDASMGKIGLDDFDEECGSFDFRNDAVCAWNKRCPEKS